jgi:hypothetical protein
VKVHFFGELIGEVAGQVFGYVCYGLGRRVVSVLTVGFVRPAEVGDENLYFPWYGVTRGRDGKVVLSDTSTIFVGLATLLVLIAVLVWVLNVLRQPSA